MANNATSKIPDDEIDFQFLGQKAYTFFAYPFRLLIANTGTTVAFIVTALLLAIALKFLMPKTYASSFILRPVDRTERMHLRILSDLQTLVKHRDAATLSRELALDSSIVKNLVAIELYNSSLKSSSDSVNYTEIELITTDYNQFIPVQAAIIRYLENNPYYLKIKTLQQKQVKAERELVDKDLQRLDSMKIIQLHERRHQTLSTQNALLLDQLTDPMSTYRMGAERMAKNTELMARESFFDNFQLVKSCIAVKHPSSPPRILIMCLYLVPAFLVLCFLFLVLRTKQREKKTVAS